MNQKLSPLIAEIDHLGSWRITLFCMVSYAIVMMVIHFRAFSALGKTLWLYVLLYSLSIFEFPFNQYGALTTAFAATSAQTFVEALFFPWLAFKHSRKLWRVIPIAAAFEILCVVFHLHGIMGNAPSLQTSFIALCVPFSPLPIAIVGVILAIFVHGTTAKMILLFEGFAWLFAMERKKWFVPIFSIAGVGVYFISDLVAGSSERINEWVKIMAVWALKDPSTITLNIKNLIIGTGPGSFLWYSLMVDNFPTHRVFIWLHSDVLQILFELGFVGLILCVGLVIQAASRSRANPKVLAGVMGSFAFSLSYYPLRYAPSMILIALIMKEALTIKPKPQSNL